MMPSLKNNLFLALAAIALTLFLGVASQLTFASGITTSSDTKNNQVITRNEDGVIYLTTQVATAAGSTDERVNRVERNANNSIFNVFYTPPQGFAENFAQLFNAIMSAVMVIAALLVLFNLIYGAFQWITSGGDKGKIEQARNRMMAAVVGIIIVASTYAMLLLVLNFLGFENLNDVFRSTRPIDGSNPPIATDSATPTASPAAESELGELL